MRDGEMAFVCPSCSPDEFIDTTPNEDKIWHHQEAFPGMYEQGKDGTLRPNDKLNSETHDWLMRNANQEEREAAIAKKRATRRTEPLKDWELRQRLNFGEKLRQSLVDRAIREGEGWVKDQLIASK